MRLKIDDFIEILGCPSTDTKVVHLLESLQLTPPVLAKNKDTFWYELDTIGYDLAFKDESIINHDEYADVGDGELIFITAYFRKPDQIGLPFGITAEDSYTEVLHKIGREEDDNNEFLNVKIWLFKREDSLEYIIFFDFDSTYVAFEKIGILYSYGQLSWVEELRNR